MPELSRVHGDLARNYAYRRRCCIAQYESPVGSSLAHSIDIVGPKHIVVANELIGVFAGAQPFLTTDPKIWVHGSGECEPADIERIIAGFPGHRLSDAACGVPAISDRALLIYTSGTTGFPKAANVSHYRVLMWSLWFAGMMNTRSSDRMYNCLPMYHSIGGVVASGAVLVNGGSVVIRDRFSASQFWDDVCALGLHVSPVYRRALPLPRARSAAAARASAPDQIVLRQWIAAGYMERIQE